MATPPSRDNSTNLYLPYQQNPRVVDMPNVASAVTRLTEALQLSLINDMVNLLEYDYENFQSIDYMSDAVRQEDISPGSKEYLAKFNEVLVEVSTQLSSGDSNSSNFDYNKFKSFFKVSYNDSSGVPEIRFALPISDNIIEDLSIVQEDR